jgi:hypothetical protein
MLQLYLLIFIIINSIHINRRLGIALTIEDKGIELQHDETVEEHGDTENTQSDPTSNNNSDEESSGNSEDDQHNFPSRTRQPPEYLRDYVTGIESIDN